MTDREYMLRALELAKIAAEGDDVPVGAVIVRDGEIIAEGYNRREQDHDATSHAEVIAIRQACERIHSWRLSDCTMYVTLEPCPMCMGASVNARLKKIVYGAKDARGGACHSVLCMNSYPLNHKIEVEHGLCERECRELLSTFFEKKRH